MADIDLIAVPLLGWPFSVLSTLSSPPGSPTLNDCHIVGASPTGAWSGHTNAIARWNASSAWEFQTPSTGRRIYDIGATAWKQWSSSAWTGDAGPLPVGGSTLQVLAKTSGTDYAVGWSTLTGTGPTQVWFFINSGTLSNGSGVIGDIAIVGGAVVNLYYKNASNVWVLGGPIAASAGGTLTGITTASGSGLSGGGTSGTLTMTVDLHGQTLKASPTTSDELLIADAAASNALKRVTIGTLPVAPSGSAGGDLSGTYPNPTVATTSALKSATTNVNVSSATAPTSGQVLTATGGSAATWQAPAGGAPTGSAGGDLGGTYPNPTVTQARGLVSATTTVSVSAATAPTTGQVLTAVNSTTATWQAPTGGAASDLATTGANVNVSAAAPGTAGQVLTLTDATHATWQAPATSTFAVLTDINPRHYWRASVTTQSGGLVDQITDSGRVPKHFTQTGTARCPTAVDGSGFTYLAPDGANDYYVQSTASDWTFLNNGSAWTMAIVYHRTAAITISQVLLDTCATASANVGLSVIDDYVSSTVQGPRCVCYAGAGNVAFSVNHRRLSTTKSVVIVRNIGLDQNDMIQSSLADKAMLTRNGTRVAYHAYGAGVSYSASAPLGALRLFGVTGGSAGSWSAPVYEIWIEDRLVPERLLRAYEGWCATAYGTPT